MRSSHVQRVASCDCLTIFLLQMLVTTHNTHSCACCLFWNHCESLLLVVIHARLIHYVYLCVLNLYQQRNATLLGSYGHLMEDHGCNHKLREWVYNFAPTMLRVNILPPIPAPRSMGLVLHPLSDVSTSPSKVLPPFQNKSYVWWHFFQIGMLSESL